MDAQRSGPRTNVAGIAATSVAGVLLLLAAAILLRAPCVGVADNGDYWRVMRPAGIDHVLAIDEPRGQFVSCRFREFPPALGSGLSSAALLAWLARYVPWTSPALGPTELDLRQVGVVYLALAAAMTGVSLTAGAFAALVTAWLYVLVDPGYLLFFNSFYGDAAALLAVLGTCLWFVSGSTVGDERSNPRRTWPGVFAIVALALLGGAAKMQYLLMPALILVALLSLRLNRTRATQPIAGHAAAAVALAAIAVAMPLHFYRGHGPRFLEVNNYHAVFAGIVQATARPQHVFSALEIPPDYQALPRQDVWSARLPLDHPVFSRMQSLSRWRLLRLYVAEPAAMEVAARRIQRELVQRRTHIRGTFARESGRRPGAQLHVAWQFSLIRSLLVEAVPAVVYLVPVCCGAWLLVAAVRRAWTGIEAAALFLLLFSATQSVAVVLGDGFVALEQHLLATRFALDLLGVLSIVAALRTAFRYRRQITPMIHLLMKSTVNSFQ